MIDLYEDANCTDLFEVYDNKIGLIQSQLKGINKVPILQWYHFAIVYKEKNAYMYVNGELTGSSSKMPDSSKINASHELNYFGKYHSNAYIINAQLDEIKIYNKGLSEAQVKLDMNTVGMPSSGICDSDLISTPIVTTDTFTTLSESNSITTTILAAKTTTPHLNLSCVSNYWPVKDNAVTDLIEGRNAKSDSPQFVKDRFGLANGAIFVNSLKTAWQIPTGRYFQGDSTLTMWVKKQTCITGNYGK
jgi:hypothetical protein